MNSSNFNKFIEDFSSITSSDANSFERVLKKYPYFQTAALFLAKSNPIQHNTQTAALRSADRRVLRSWLDEAYRKELEREKQEVEARQAALEIENDENKKNLDINTESINAFDKLVGTTTVLEKKEEVEIKLEEDSQETETSVENTQESISENENTSVNSFFDEIEDDNSITKIEKTEKTENKVDSSSFFDDLENNEELEKISTTTSSSDVNFFDEVDNMNDSELEEPIYKEQSDINDPLPTSIPAETTDANFFDELSELNDDELEETIYKEQSDINTPFLDAPVLEVPPTTTDANFFDEIEGDDTIFGDAQKDLDNYDAPDFSDFPDFEEEKEEIEKNKKVNEDAKEDRSFFDDI